MSFLIPLVAGIFSCYQFYKGLAAGLLFLPFAVVLLFILFNANGFLFRNYRYRWIGGFLSAVFLFSSGWVLTALAMPSVIEKPQHIIAAGKVVDSEEGSGLWNRLLFSPRRVNQTSVPLKAGDLWVLMYKDNPAFDVVEPGQTILVKGRLQPLPVSGNPYGFEYGQYLFRQGVAAQMFVSADSLMVIDATSRADLQGIAAAIRKWSIANFAESGIHGPALELLNAVVLGERSGVDRELNDKFIRSGAIHLLAVSGLHVGIVYLFLNYLFSLFFKSNNSIRLVFTILLLFFYAFITGFSPSVTRAVLMFSLIQTGRVFLRPVNIFNILALSAFIILLYNPLYLFHAGFWLSHLAVGGIVAFYPVIYGLLSFKFIVWRWVWSLISVSVAAQISTFPLSLWLFGAFPSYFLLTNLLLLPIMAPVLILALLILAGGSIPLVKTILGAPLQELLVYMENTVRFVESMPGAYLTDIWVSLVLMALLYFCIIIWSLFLDERKPRYLIQGFAAILLVFGAGLTQWTSKKTACNLVVFNANGHLLVEVTDRGMCSGFVSEGLAPDQLGYVASGYERRHVITHHGFVTIPEVQAEGVSSVYRINLQKKKYCLVHGDGRFAVNQSIAPSDVLILSGTPQLDLMELIQQLECTTVVFASDCPARLTKAWKQSIEGEGIQVHDVKNKGAYVEKLR